MDYGYDDRRPNEHVSVPALATSQESKQAAADYFWIEKHIPYSGDAEKGINWFIRFDRL
jgi:hypothetical protein